MVAVPVKIEVKVLVSVLVEDGVEVDVQLAVAVGVKVDVAVFVKVLVAVKLLVEVGLSVEVAVLLVVLERGDARDHVAGGHHGDRTMRRSDELLVDRVPRRVGPRAEGCEPWPLVSGWLVAYCVVGCLLPGPGGRAETQLGDGQEQQSHARQLQDQRPWLLDVLAARGYRRLLCRHPESERRNDLLAA